MSNESAYVSLGSNLGDRAANLLLGIRGMMEAGSADPAPFAYLRERASRNILAAGLPQHGCGTGPGGSALS